MAIYRGPGGAGDATNDATSQAILAAASAVAAANSEAAAAASAVTAANSATSATSSANNAANSATNAADSAANAANSATSAAASATTATNKASEAATSATNAASSATSAATSATNASNSATSAASSASTATTKAAEASTSATAAAASATAAATSEANADISEANAASSATAAASSATSAAASATSATNSASTAATQATNAANSASAAATSASNAATSETNAANSASAAATSATNAANSATSASTSATNAANSATAAAASYDSFDDRYLGSKTSNPTLDNDGNALLTGALYWNSTVGEMRVYNGSAWVAAYVPAATYVAKAGDVMTGSLEVPTQASLKATTLTRASIRPSLLLDFANTKQLDPRITFSRPTTATYYDGKTVVKAEENLLTYSQEFDNAAWTKTASTVTANSTTAPDGSTTADTLAEDTSSSFHRVYGTFSCISGLAYTFSVYAKAGTRNYLQIFASTGFDTTQAYANFDLSTGSVGTVGTASTASITSIGNGWYRCSMISVATSSSAGAFVNHALITSSSSTRAESYLGTGSTIYLWGAQLEQRSTVTAYTPTTTAPITNYIPALQTAVSNDARFDHDPVTGESKGLLIEEQRTNLLTYSQEFDNAAWSKGAVTVQSNTIVAPDGTLTADKLIEDASNAEHRLRVTNITKAANQVLSYSVYAKPAGRYFVLAMEFSGLGLYTTFDVSTNQYWDYAADTGWTRGQSIITSVGNGWYRCSISGTTDTATTVNARVHLTNVANAQKGTIYTGDGYSGIYIWGAQLEAGSFPTSYIPTVASQVTRSADSASMTGSNFSSWYRADEGTAYVEWMTVNFKTIFNIGFYDGAASYIQPVENTNSWAIINNNVRQAGGAFGAGAISGVFAKSTLAYKTNDAAFVFNGGTVQTDASVIVPVVDRLIISSTLDGTIKRIAYYPKRLSNTELQGLTS